MKTKKAQKILQVSKPTLLSYIKKGKIKAKKDPKNGYWIYDDDSVYKLSGIKEGRKVAIYGRVSTVSQQKDLENQIEILKEFANKNGDNVDLIYKDIASGLTFDRKSFKNMISKVMNNEIKTIYITYKDRFSRISFDMWKSLCDEKDCNIVILNQPESDEKEIFEDIISLLHCFSMRMYSKRRKRKLEIIEEDLKNEIE